MVYDQARQKVVLFGGVGPTSVLNDTWEWDGKDWIRRTPGVSPPARWTHCMAYDEHRQRTVLYGGLGAGTLYDTWDYTAGDLVPSANLVSVRTGGHVKLALDAGSRCAGRNYIVLGCIDGTGTRGLPLADNVVLRLYPDLYFWLTLLCPNGLITNSLGTLDGGGRATATLRVPARLPTALIDCRFYHAYVVFGSSIEYASTPVPLTLTP